MRSKSVKHNIKNCVGPATNVTSCGLDANIQFSEQEDGDMSERGSSGATVQTDKKSVPVPLCQPKLPFGLIWT
jgi:hypothetical protein